MRTLEIPLIDCEFSAILTCSVNGFIKFNRRNKKLYISVVILSPQYNAKLIKKLKSCLKQSIDWKRYESKIPTQATKSVFGLPDESSF